MMLGNDLAYVALATRDVTAPAGVFERQLGLSRIDLDDGAGHKIPTFMAGRAAIAIFPVGHPYLGSDSKVGVHHIALGVTDLGSGLRAAEEAGIGAPSGVISKSLSGRSRVELAHRDLCGVRTFLTEPLDLKP